MYYFTYGSNMNARAVTDWCRHAGVKVPQLRDPKPAVLDNYRLGFPIYSDYWGGGIADVVFDPGKRVMGVMWTVTEKDLAVVDRKLNRRLDPAGQEVGVHKRIAVEVQPVSGGPTVKAVAYTGVDPQKFDVPPTQVYMESLIAGAYEAGLSMMWISYLQSFQTQPGAAPGKFG